MNAKPTDAQDLTPFSLVPRTLEQALQFAELVAKSDAVPKDYQGKPGNVLVAMQYGIELGLAPMTMLQNSYVVNGRPALFGDIGLALIKRQSDYVDTIETIDEEKTKATCIAKRRDHADVERTFSMTDAVQAGLDKPRGNQVSLYKLYPKRMLQMRARWWALRDQWPDVLKGVAIREDLAARVIEGEAILAEPLSTADFLRDEIAALVDPQHWNAIKKLVELKRAQLSQAEYTELASALNAAKQRLGIETKTEKVRQHLEAVSARNKEGPSTTDDNAPDSLRGAATSEQPSTVPTAGEELSLPLYE